ncbi:hypothetical protein ACTXPA_17580 [Glutamicibacter arilaitensis]|uniref:hypothetical protein n=1 Tax=Glutamicibacter arilaitensis TaxID=256701 RepID=UPI003FD30048
MYTHIKIKKDPYIWPSWIVTYEGHTIGSAHSLQIARMAADFAVAHVKDINPANLCASYLVTHVLEDMRSIGYQQFWTPQRVATMATAA